MGFETNHPESLNSCISNSSKAVQNFSRAGDPSRLSYASFIMPTLFGISCLLVLKKSGPSSSVPDILISLSMVDLLFLLGMPFLTHQPLGNRAWHFRETVCTAITALDASRRFTSTYILTTMSIDCYLVTVYPFTPTCFRKPPLAILVICVLWALSFLRITPMWMYAQLIPLPGGLLSCGSCLPDPHPSRTFIRTLSTSSCLCHPFCTYHHSLQEDPAEDGQALRSTDEPEMHQGSNHKTDPYNNCYLHGLLHLLGTFPHPTTGPACPDSPHPAFLLGLQHGDASESGQPLLHLVSIPGR
uniref:G-protein coupled receptors family 1 profile domain-containing protein n=1 Tax=Apteryx owenii TaxID=8824 RepID=A0A8B9NXM5_APTOW